MIKIYFSVYFSLSCYLKTANFARLDFSLVLRPKLHLQILSGDGLEINLNFSAH